jgi:hypothetical protein
MYTNIYSNQGKYPMILAILLLFVGLILSGVAIYYSVFGLTAIFSAAVIPIIVMGSALEVAKLVCASWLKANWYRIPLSMKTYMSTAVVVLMLITSMGIFGFLSKAHSDQSLVSGDVQARIAVYDEKINTARENIEADRKQLKQMDEAVDQVMGRSQDEKGADKANAIRKSQQRDRSALAKDIEANQTNIAKLNDEAAPVRAENRKVEAEVGPIKYIAKFIYGEDGASENMLEKAVTWVIILIVIVFDPLAVIMLLASQMTFQWHKENKETEDPWDIAGKSQELNKEDEEPTEPCPKCGTALMNAPGIGPYCPNKECDVVDGPLLYKEQQEEPVAEVEPVPEPVTPAYLNKPFAHFKNLKPMPAPHIEPEPEELDLEEIDSLLQELAVYDNERLVSNYDKVQPEVREESTPIEEVQDEEASTAEVAPIVQPEIQTLGIDVIDRPGDYVTEPVAPRPVIREAAPGRNRGKMHNAHEIVADNVENLGAGSNSGFGNEFPVNPEKGDTFLRTDFLPNRLFKFNSHKWIEVDKDKTDVYAYDDMYIKHLIDEIGSGRYDIDSLTDLERDQIAEYLKRASEN